MGNGRVIFHVDMNCFYASVEAALNPKLRGRPLAIAGDVKTRHGIVVTSSYEARAFGVKTTMTVGQAKRLCPELIIMPPNFERYRQASTKIFEILGEYTSLVQRVSIDEGYLDMTERMDDESPPKLALSIQQRLRNELLLPCSIGIAPNKFLAKTASDMKKPFGITILRKRDVPAKLWPLKAGKMHGIGKKTEEKLNRIGIVTIADLANAEDYLLKEALGVNGPRMKRRANGIDRRPVDPEAESEFKSIGSSTTLPADTTEEKNVQEVLLRLARSVSKRMSRKECVAWNIQLTIRYNDRKTITRSRKLQNPVGAPEDIHDAARLLWKQHWNGEPIRLLGITAQDLLEKDEANKQLDLFTYPEEEKASLKREALHDTVQRIREKYGDEAIKRNKKH
ncbi:MAG TPA: DNA polymerase IV [Bacillales bacterium]|nr:DNA polymerase IV [Bacillales bacterium]